MRIAIYARVSTDDKGQDPENQLRQLRQWCAGAGHEVVREYVDHESGQKDTKDRKQFAALWTASPAKATLCDLSGIIVTLERYPKASDRSKLLISLRYRRK